MQHKEMSRQNGLDERNYRSHPGTSILACYCDFCSTSTLYAEKRRPSFCLFPFHDMSNHRVDMASHWGLKQTLDLCLSEPEPGFESQNTKKRVFLPKKLLSSLEAKQTLFSASPQPLMVHLKYSSLCIKKKLFRKLDWVFFCCCSFGCN